MGKKIDFRLYQHEFDEVAKSLPGQIQKSRDIAHAVTVQGRLPTRVADEFGVTSAWVHRLKRQYLETYQKRSFQVGDVLVMTGNMSVALFVAQNAKYSEEPSGEMVVEKCQFRWEKVNI